MTQTPHLAKGFLNGVRIIDLTWKAVGPWGPRMLTPFGAEVIHIEPPHEPDDHRWDLRHASGINAQHQVEHHDGIFGTPGQPYFTAPYYSQIHNGKLAVSLNTRHPEGKRLFERLVEISDGLCENFSARVLDNWGLGWERMH